MPRLTQGGVLAVQAAQTILELIDLGLWHVVEFSLHRVEDAIDDEGLLLGLVQALQDVLLLEEPTASLDLRSQYEVWDFLQEMRGSKTIIYTTHSIREAERVHDRLVIMDHGKVALDGTLDRLLENAGELFHFQIHFKKLPKELYKNMSKVTTVVSPSQIGEVFDFYARERKVFFDIMELAIQEELLDYAADKVGLETLIMTSTEEQLR